jgi:hypothetical protein
MTLNKTFILTAAVVIVLVGGYFAYAATMPKGTDTNTTMGTPAPADQAKINIDQVCQGALAYMTFTDAASAELFVQECKEGKHPEVIEQYKAQMNLDGTSI